MRGADPCKIFRDIFGLQGVMVLVKGELSGWRMDHALEEILQSMQEQFSAQPSRQRAVAAAVGRDSVDIVVATKLASGDVLYQHSKEQSLSLSSDSPGMQHLVAALTVSPEASGYVSMQPPQHTPQLCEYKGPVAPLKYVVSDEPSLSTQVYSVNIRKPGSSKAEAAILKIRQSPLIDAEVCPSRVCVTIGDGHLDSI